MILKDGTILPAFPSYNLNSLLTAIWDKVIFTISGYIMKTV
jgi:hypothetical protein